MTIKVKYVDADKDLVYEFVDQGYEQRLWIWDRTAHWFRTVSHFCPHTQFSGYECQDCSLNVE